MRAASVDELPALAETISLAFHDDPTWSWAFPDPKLRQEQFGVFWAFMIAGALRYSWVMCTDHHEAVAIWIPPGGTELPEEDEARLAPLLASLVGLARTTSWSYSHGATLPTRTRSPTSI